MSGRIIHSNQSLVLQKVTKQSAGRYICSVVNSEGETLSNELYFRVQYIPICKNEKIIVVGASKRESVDIPCEIEADPPAKAYRWKFNNSGETLDVAAERFLKTSNGSISILRYTPVSDLDYGSLSCWASNVVGHQINPCIFQMVAAGKPFAVRNCSMANQTASTVEVYCLPGFDGGLPQYFVLELYSENSRKPMYNMTSYVEPFFSLEHLDPYITFKVVIFAMNAKGRSQPITLEGTTFGDVEKHIASDGELPFSQVLGIAIGSTLTVTIIILLIILRIRKSSKHRDGNFEHNPVGTIDNNRSTVSSTKRLLHSSIPKDGDEREPDVIPANFGSPDGEHEKRMNVSLKGSTLPTAVGHITSSVSCDMTKGIPSAQWDSSVKKCTDKEANYHQYTNPSVVVGTFPRESRPKDLRLGNGTSTTSDGVHDLELNGFAIKERLMANRLPESCV